MESERMLTMAEFLEALEEERGIKLTRQTAMRYLKSGRVPGAVIGKDESGVRRAWRIPESSIEVFEPKPRGNPKLRGE